MVDDYSGRRRTLRDLMRENDRRRRGVLSSAEVGLKVADEIERTQKAIEETSLYGLVIG